MVSKIKVDEIESSQAGGSVAHNSPMTFKGYTTSQINALSGMAAGDTVYDSDLGTIKVYNGESWNAMSSNTFSFAVSYLVIAGGGAGGGGNPDHGAGGGGGAGGYRTSYASDDSGGGNSTESTISASKDTSYVVTIGAGGAGVTGRTNGNPGSDSVFSTITSVGGGYGAGFGYAGGDGGSGGGAGWGGGENGGTATSQQGYNGGIGGGGTGSARTAAGGGGAGAAGGNGANNNAGDGGAGLSSSITGSSLARAGGGGGGGSSGTGGNGGGGNGGVSNGAGADGTVNTGSGGGGTHNSGQSGDGGSGLVILRYSNEYTISNIGGGLTFTTSTSGNDKITTFTAGTGTVTFS